MKILFLTRLYNPHIGGVEKHVKRLTEELIKDGHTVTIITEQYESSLSVSESGNVKIYRIPLNTTGFKKKFEIWRWFWHNRTLLDNTDIIHCHDVFFWILPYRLFHLTKKIYTTFHGYESYPVSMKAIIIRKISELLSSGSICVGEFMKKWYYARPDIITYGAVDIPHVQSKPTHRNNAVFFGRLDDQTGIDGYVRAYKEIKKYYPKFKLAVVGDGPHENIITKDIIHTHFKKDVTSDIRSNRFIFVSRYLSILEALIHKRLVFAVYTSPIHRDYLLMSPFREYIVVARDEQDLTSKVNYYITHPHKEQELINQGFEWAQKQSWTRLLAQYYQLWK